MAKYKKGEHIRVGMKGSSEMHEGELMKLGLTHMGHLFVRIKRSNGLPVMFLGPKAAIIIERV